MEKNNSNIPDITFSGDITVNGPMFDIHDNEHVYIGRPDKRVTKINDSGVKKENVERNEERFHFVHPEIEDEEAWRIHQSIKRLVAYQKIPEICAYLKELKQKGKVLLPSVSAVLYNELVRLGMPTGDGYSEKHFSNSYTK